MTITRGTTPELFCVIPDEISVNNIKEIWISIAQMGKILVDRKLSDGGIIVNVPNLTFKLSQEDSLKFGTYSSAYCGVRILLNDGTALASKKEEVVICDVVKGGVMT
ncbi:hypothetical protein [Bacteroides sp.]|uniref:hypothetical protein n=1 Tax=Bacteroides sp. TaxID=29523 RepID=UPI00262E8B6F|nr:hypothetical protein [Bacteroides sp.]MDD3040088.1 hypothetical protein [Bacteroides sp.]